MRRFALLVLLLSCAACARKAQPVADGGAPELPDLPPVEVKPKKALDPNNFAGKSLAQWREDLRSKDRHKIIAAMKACEALGPLAADAVPDILAADIKVPNVDAHVAVWRAHSEFGAMKREVWPGVAKAIGKGTVPHLLPWLDVPDQGWTSLGEKWTRADLAMTCLSAIGPDAADAIPKLSELVGHTKSELCNSAARTLLDIGGSDKRAVPGLLLAVKSNLWVRPRVIDALSRLDPEGTAEECIVATTVREQWDSKSLPAEVFARFGPKGVALAVARCKRADGSLDYGPIKLLASAPAELLAPHATEIVEWLDTAVKGKFPYLYYPLLHKLGSQAKEAIPRLLELAGTGDLEALVAAARTGATWQQVSKVMWARKDRVAEAAGEILPVYGASIRGEVAPFAEHMKTARPKDKASLALAILDCDPTHDGATEAFLECVALNDQSAAVPLSRRKKPPSPIVVRVLRAGLKHENPQIRARAADRLLEFAPADPDPEAIRQVAAGVISKEEDGTYLLHYRLDHLATSGDAGVKAIGELLTNKTLAKELAHAKVLVDVRTRDVAKLLAHLGERAGAAAPALKKCLETEANPDVIGYAFRALGNLSSPEKPLALEAARSRLNSEHRWVKFSAAEALLKCDPSNEDALKVLADFVKPVLADEWFSGGRMGITDRDSSYENSQYQLPFGIRGEAVPLLFRLDPERAIRTGAFRNLWFVNELQ